MLIRLDNWAVDAVYLGSQLETKTLPHSEYRMQCRASHVVHNTTVTCATGLTRRRRILKTAKQYGPLAGIRGEFGVLVGFERSISVSTFLWTYSPQDTN
jgi:hypothetical protein